MKININIGGKILIATLAEGKIHYPQVVGHDTWVSQISRSPTRIQEKEFCAQ